MPPEGCLGDAPWLIGEGEWLGAWWFDGHLIVVDLAAGILRLYNPSALAIWLLLHEEKTEAELIHELAAIYEAEPDEVRVGVKALLIEWFGFGWIHKLMDSYRLTYGLGRLPATNDLSITSDLDGSLSCQTTFCPNHAVYRVALAVPVTVYIDAADDAQSRAVCQRLCAILAGFPMANEENSADKSLVIRIDGSDVIFSECGISNQVAADATEVISQTMLRLLKLGYPQERLLATIHAAGLYNPKTNEGIIFPGVSGAGKSTLAVALADRGWSYLGDDIIGLSDRQLILPLPTAASVKAATWDIFHNHQVSLEQLPLISYSGKSAKYLPVMCADNTVAVPLNRWVFPVFERDADLSVNHIAPIEVLQGLMDAGMGLSEGLATNDIDDFLQMLYKTPAYRVAYSNLDEVDQWFTND